MTTPPNWPGRSCRLWGVLVGWTAMATCSVPNPHYTGAVSHDGGRDAATGPSDAVAGPDQEHPPGDSGKLETGTVGPLPDGSVGAGGSGGTFNPDPDASGGAGGAAGTDAMVGTDATGGMDAAAGVGGAGGMDAVKMDVTAPPPDAATTPDVTSNDVGLPSATCGSGMRHAAVASIVGARGIAIDAKGAIFYTHELGPQTWIGRFVPGATVPEPTWVPLAANAHLSIVRADSARNLVFVASTGTNMLVAANTLTGKLAASITGIPAPHGLALAPDGAVFISSGDGHIWRSLPDLAGGQPSLATTAVVFPAPQRPMGMAFGPTGELFVGSSNGGIKRYRLVGLGLVDPKDYSVFSGPVHDLAFDTEGRLFVAGYLGTTARPLVQIEPGGLVVKPINQVTGRLAGLAFGRGGLDCHELNIAVQGEAARTWRVSQPGLDLQP